MRSRIQIQDTNLERKYDLSTYAQKIPLRISHTALKCHIVVRVRVHIRVHGGTSALALPSSTCAPAAARSNGVQSRGAPSGRTCRAKSTVARNDAPGSLSGAPKRI
ncbi:hypothetical protein A0H81_07324 [Grifola frondosa]|uniref:Uncharacterized protein n=1 Tax=Grifola frondosa TaxID=5627 RepID=A0A1C7M8N5_GRIFR|nr:hypothetical protein A0H81_07324 [Grifola frondosa]